jgi:type I restriction-modification system DNA methylase subunit
MALKKSQLYSSLWQSCDELRGGMDASQYKDYVLTLLFMKYVSDKAEVGRDGITYLVNARDCGVMTVKGRAYEALVLELTGAMTLEVALERARAN